MPDFNNGLMPDLNRNLIYDFLNFVLIHRNVYEPPMWYQVSLKRQDWYGETEPAYSRISIRALRLIGVG